MKEIVTAEKLLDDRGRLLRARYSRHMNFVLDKKLVRSPRLKEWDFYQIHFDGRYVLQLTLGHVSYAMQCAATLIDLASGQRHVISKLATVKPSFKRDMPANPEVANTLQYFSRNVHVQFETTDKFRRLAFTANDYHGIKAEVYLMLTNVSKSKEKMVIATPFDKPKQWYLNYKENCFVVNGYVRIQDVAYQITDGFGLLDWGRGIWPYRHKWVWGNGGTNVNGKSFGFNIGWGFGDTSAATENAFFYDNKLYKLGEVQEIKLGESYRYVDQDERFVFEVEPIFNNHTHTRVLWVNNKCCQTFGMWSGYVILDNGVKLTVPPFVAFCEHAQNQW